MAIKTLRASSWFPMDCISAPDPFREAWTFGCAREASPLPTQETQPHRSVNAYPFAGSEFSDPYAVAYPPGRLLAARDREMRLRLGAFRTFHVVSRLQTSQKVGRESSCEDYWSDASLSLPGFATPNGHSEAKESPKLSTCREAYVSCTPPSSDMELARQEPSYKDKLGDIVLDGYDETASALACDIDEEQREEKRSVMNMRYDVFPPPIISPTICNANTHLPSCMQRVPLRSIKKDGRLILQELPVSAPQRYLRAERENGRLRLLLIDVEPFEDQAFLTEEIEEKRCEAKRAEEEGGEEQEEEETEEQEAEGEAQVDKLEEEENEDEAELDEEDDLYAFAATSELEFYRNSEDWSVDDAKGNSIQRLTSRSTNPMAPWVTSRDFLQESLNRIRPLVY